MGVTPRVGSIPTSGTKFPKKSGDSGGLRFGRFSAGSVRCARSCARQRIVSPINLRGSVPKYPRIHNRIPAIDRLRLVAHHSHRCESGYACGRLPGRTRQRSPRFVIRCCMNFPMRAAASSRPRRRNVVSSHATTRRGRKVSQSLACTSLEIEAGPSSSSQWV